MKRKIDIIKKKIISCEMCRHNFDRKKCILARRDFSIHGEVNRAIPGWCPLLDDMEYKSGEYCQAIRCTSYGLPKELRKCETCGAYQFYKWLKEKNLLKEVNNEYKSDH